jgi:hypothetical protein
MTGRGLCCFSITNDAQEYPGIPNTNCVPLLPLVLASATDLDDCPRQMLSQLPKYPYSFSLNKVARSILLRSTYHHVLSRQQLVGLVVLLTTRLQAFRSTAPDMSANFDLNDGPCLCDGQLLRRQHHSSAIHPSPQNLLHWAQLWNIL